MSKYGAIRTFSHLCERWFDSKAEARRGEELCLLEKAGEIAYLQYQIPFVLCEKPKITITIDFSYLQDFVWVTPPKGGRWASGKRVYEDSKSGILTRDSRTKLAWLKEKHGVLVLLTK